MSGLFNICSSVNCIECSKEHLAKCPTFQPLSVCTSWKQKRQLNELFGEDLTQKSVLQDINENYFGNHLMSAIKKKSARQFLEAQIAPILLPALLQMELAKPEKPVEWLADWLTLHDPDNRD